MKIAVQLPEKIFGLETVLLKIFVLPIFLLLLFLISFFKVVLPKFDQIASLKRETNEVTRKKTLVEKKRDYLLTVNEEELQKKADFLAKALLQQKDAYTLVGVVRKIAAKYGFYIQSFLVSPGEMSGDENKKKELEVSKIPIAFVLTGPKEKYLDLMMGIERSLPVLAVDSFDMSSAVSQVELNLRVSSYYIEEKKEFNIVEVDLLDLMLSAKEEEMLSTLSSFDFVGREILPNQQEKDFVEYGREDPFNL
ncbi:hypothetical protein KJ909_02035 [Patescibacteria group bacterium]|nr:hypothetical protein [Patescibacteria group bacterium]